MAQLSGRFLGLPTGRSSGEPSDRAVLAYEVLTGCRAAGGGKAVPDEFSAIIEPGPGSLVGLARWTIANEVIRPALARLDSEGVPVWAWKGLDYAQTIYPSPRMRPMKDIDILLRPGSRWELVNILASSGWRRTDRSDHLLQAGIVGSASFSRGAVDLDVHFHPFHFPACLPGVLPEGLLSDGRPLSQGLLALVPGYSLLMHFLHMLQHGCTREMWWLDAALLARRMAPSDWRLFAGSAGPTGLARAFALLLGTLSDAFSTAVPGAVTDSLARAPDRSWILPLLRGGRGMPTASALVALAGWRRISFAAGLLVGLAGGRTRPGRRNSGGR